MACGSPGRQTEDDLLALESYRGGYFFPYPFDFDLHGIAADAIHAPWSSGMAQGQALSLFSRLADTTGDPAWRSAADATFASLLLPPDPSNKALPFVSWVDSAQHLWIDEYAEQPLSKSDRTFNGDIFAIFGVWDYYRTSLRVHRVTGSGLDAQGRPSQRGCLVEAALSWCTKASNPLYHQFVAVRRRESFDQRPRLLLHVGHARGTR